MSMKKRDLPKALNRFNLKQIPDYILSKKVYLKEMEKVKKILLIALVVALMTTMLLIGISCKEEEKGGDLIGVTMPTKSLQRWNQDGANIKEQLEAKGYTVDLQYAENDVNAQLSQLENQITMGCKVLVIASIDGSALSEVLSKAADAGIKSIAYDRLIMETKDTDYYASFDNFKVGVLQGTFIEEALGLADGDGPFNIELVAGSPDDNNATLFFNGAMSIIQPYIDSGQLVVVSGQTDFLTIATPAWTSATAT